MDGSQQAIMLPPPLLLQEAGRSETPGIATVGGSRSVDCLMVGDWLAIRVPLWPTAYLFIYFSFSPSSRLQ